MDQEFESQVSINDYLRILYQSRWIIIISFIVVLVATVYITFTTPPQYEATTTIMIESSGSEDIFSGFHNSRPLFFSGIEIPTFSLKQQELWLVLIITHRPSL